MITTINHPVHIRNDDNKTSFIPFCEIGGNMSAMGVKIDKFDFPVCNSFKATITNDQLCYEVDMNRFVQKNTFSSYLKLGLTLIMDYNEDRQVTFNKKRTGTGTGLTNSLIDSSRDNTAVIYLNTIGKEKM